MDRRMVGLAVAAMVIVASVAGLSWYRDDVRSEMVPVNGDISGNLHGNVGVFIDGESCTGLSLRAEIAPIYNTAEGTYCEMTMSVDGQSVDDVRFTLSYGYLAEADTMVPIDARAVFVSGDDATYEYADPLTGHEITFIVMDGDLHSTEVVGGAVVEVDGGLRYADIDMTVVYDRDLRFVNDILDAEPSPTRVFRISGEEGGVPMEGTVTVSSVSATISKGQIREYVQVGISIEGTRLPGFLTSFYSIYGDGGSFYNGLDGTGVLLSDGTYVLSDSTIRQNPEEGFVMEGTVTVYQLDGDGGLVRTDGFDFSYGVV